MKVVIELAGEPRGKGRPRFIRATGHAYTPAASRDYEENLRYAAQVAMKNTPPMQGPLIVEVLATLPIPASWSKKKQADARNGIEWPTKKPDVDNMLKMLDALNMVVWCDDSQIVDACVRKIYGERPALRIAVERIVTLEEVMARNAQRMAVSPQARGEDLFGGEQPSGLLEAGWGPKA